MYGELRKQDQIDQRLATLRSLGGVFLCGGPGSQLLVGQPADLGQMATVLGE